ncbi:hypothetical protein LJC36_05040 [Desulfovibrio sp. OttesenSCG-928-C14]|nr:hypothetical protein [Desulfovibrio sp. OttesenSCG-928-C14]
MPKYSTELFGQLVYAPEISYEDLISLEEENKVKVNGKLEAFQAQFIHFESEGDRTYFQCVFQGDDPEDFLKISSAFVDVATGMVECKILFVIKTLSAVHFFTISQGKLSQKRANLPPAGPIDASLKD